MAQPINSNQDMSLTEYNVSRLAWQMPNPRNVIQQDIEYLRQRRQEGKTAFVDRNYNAFYFENDLLGYPFFFATLPVWESRTGKFGQQEVAKVGICIMNEDGTLNPPLLAQFSHKYLLSDLRDRTENQLRGHCYTLARNPDLPLTPRGEYPISLKYYEWGIDRVEEEEEEELTTQQPQVVQSAPLGRQLPSPEQMNTAREQFGLGNTVASEPPRWQQQQTQPQHSETWQQIQEAQARGQAQRGGMQWQEAQQMQPPTDQQPAQVNTPRRGPGRPRKNLAQ